MINYIWFFLIFMGIVFSIFTGNVDKVTMSVVSSADSTIKLIIGIVGVMCFWCGIIKIAEKSGLMKILSKGLRPILKFIFKKEGRDEEAMGAIIMNMTSNMMGVSNAATPFGIKAMEEMQKLNPSKDRASDDMVTFLVLNAACIQFIPTTVISIRAAAGSANPGIIIVPAIIATSLAAVVGVIVCKILQRYF